VTAISAPTSALGNFNPTNPKIEYADRRAAKVHLGQTPPIESGFLARPPPDPEPRSCQISVT